MENSQAILDSIVSIKGKIQNLVSEQFDLDQAKFWSEEDAEARNRYIAKIHDECANIGVLCEVIKANLVALNRQQPIARQPEPASNKVDTEELF